MENKKFSWSEKKINIQDLILDNENLRLKGNKKLNEKEIIEQLVRRDDILSLASKISKNGFTPVERIIVIEKKRRNIVIEGNRRLVALKCLLDPKLAGKENVIKKFEQLQRDFPLDSIKKIPVCIAPNREEALRKFIIPKHTESSIKSWSTYSQSKLYSKLILDQGFTVDEVCSEYNTDKARVLKALKEYQCYEIATKIPFPPEIRPKVLDERRFPITTLYRVINTDNFQKFLGIKFDTEGKLKGTVKKEEFIKGYSKIINDIASKKETSRTLHSEENRDRYLKEFERKDKPNLKKSGRFSSKSFNTITSEPQSVEKKSKPIILKRKLDAYGFNIRLQSESDIILKIYEEIKSIDFYKKPYTFAIVFRSFLHICCIQFARENGLLSEIKENREKKRNEGPSLNEILSFFLKNTFKEDRGIIRSIHDFINKETKNGVNLNVLNTIAHSNVRAISGEDLKKMLSSLEQFLRKLFAGG